ncbi:RNase P modulator RnpM [Selenomonas ruminantium]|uniref:RNase P modulator RnpM n=1 Tax=Selenomonas ruminantium TaxID=971 RepID=UPI000944FD05|nr:YlxR family protein [Selenomonas ruminantium]
MKTRKIPQRMCLGCQESKPKRELIRIVRSPEGEFSVDTTGKKPGRGAYICPKMECFNAARKSKGLERSFKSPIDKSVYELLEQQLKELPEAEG